MKLGQQVVLLELSKELKEAGYKQEGLFWWVVNTFFSDEDKPLKYYLSREEKGFDSIVAPTVAELGEALPSPVTTYHKNSDTKYRVAIDVSLAKYIWTGIGDNTYKPINFYADTEANVRALMWLYLKKENLL